MKPMAKPVSPLALFSSNCARSSSLVKLGKSTQSSRFRYSITKLFVLRNFKSCRQKTIENEQWVIAKLLINNGNGFCNIQQFNAHRNVPRSKVFLFQATRYRCQHLRVCLFHRSMVLLKAFFQAIYGRFCRQDHVDPVSERPLIT